MPELILGVESSCDETGLALYDSERGLVDEVRADDNPEKS
jgi:tRNA A37 threonylcarbamoyltransferase TsaD